MLRQLLQEASEFYAERYDGAILTRISISDTIDVRSMNARSVLAHGLASGMLSGIVSRLLLMALLYPLDTIRVRVQVKTL
jgi:hypothetical protein